MLTGTTAELSSSLSGLGFHPRHSPTTTTHQDRTQTLITMFFSGEEMVVVVAA